MVNELVDFTGISIPGLDFAMSFPSQDDLDCASDPLSRGAEFLEFSYEF